MDKTLSEIDMKCLSGMFAHAKKWSSEHGIAVGIAEMTLGASIVAYGVQSGAIEVGREFVGTMLGNERVSDKVAEGVGGIGSSLACELLAKSILVSVGVASGGTLAIPALIAIQGGSLVAGALGAHFGKELWQSLNPPADILSVLEAGAPLLIGAALLIDGCRRIIQDEAFLNTMSVLKDGSIELVKTSSKVICRSAKSFKNLIAKVATAEDASASAASACASAAAGAAIGGSLAASSVTVLGSSSLGAVALSLGLVSAPLWPVIAGGAAGVTVGYAGWKSIKFLRKT